MRRPPLAAIAALLVIPAAPIAASGGEPIDIGRPWAVAGVVRHLHPGYVLIADDDSEVALIARPRDLSALARLSILRPRVRLGGIRHEHESRPYLIVETIEELP